MNLGRSSMHDIQFGRQILSGLWYFTKQGTSLANELTTLRFQVIPILPRAVASGFTRSMLFVCDLHLLVFIITRIMFLASSLENYPETIRAGHKILSPTAFRSLKIYHPLQLCKNYECACCSPEIHHPTQHFRTGKCVFSRLQIPTPPPSVSYS